MGTLHEELHAFSCKKFPVSRPAPWGNLVKTTLNKQQETQAKATIVKSPELFERMKVKFQRTSQINIFANMFLFAIMLGSETTSTTKFSNKEFMFNSLLCSIYSVVK